MSRITLLILFLLTSMMMVAETPATINVTQKTPADSVGKYRLYVVDIPEFEEMPVYGQIQIGNPGSLYGGENVKNFEKFYTEANKEAKKKGAEINRDENGIYFSIPENSNLDTLTVHIVCAKNIPKKDGSPDWNRDKDNIVPVRWILHPANGSDGNEVEAAELVEESDVEESELIPDPEVSEASEAGGSWAISKVDWILFALVIVALAVALLRIGSKKQNKEYDYDAERAIKEEVRRSVMSLQAEITNIKAINNSNKETIDKLDKEILDLKNKVGILTTKMTERERPVQERGLKVSTSKPTVATAPQIVGYAKPEDNTLVLTDVTSAFFEITLNPDEKFSFTLVQSEDVMNLFSTNAGMLNFYRQKGIISYDEIPQNSHVTVSAPGVVKPDTDSSFKVLTPLKLSFV